MSDEIGKKVCIEEGWRRTDLFNKKKKETLKQIKRMKKKDAKKSIEWIID